MAGPLVDHAIAGVLRHSSFVARGGGRRREIALTFDDGPGPYTPGVLIALNRLNVKATFFLVGRQAWHARSSSARPTARSTPPRWTGCGAWGC